MKFVLSIQLKKTTFVVSKQIKDQINTLFRNKQRQVGAKSHKVIKVLVTDSQHQAQAHDELHDTITLLLIKESTRVEGGIIASYLPELPVNLQKALDTLHIPEDSSVIYVVN